MNIGWTCPDCGAVNSNDINHAQYCTCICEECKAECEVYFEIEVTEVKKVNLQDQISPLDEAGNAKKAKGIENKIDDDKTCFTCNFLIDHFVCEIHGEIKDENNHVCNNYKD
jgi:hypothetical protein